MSVPSSTVYPASFDVNRQLCLSTSVITAMTSNRDHFMCKLEFQANSRSSVNSLQLPYTCDKTGKQWSVTAPTLYMHIPGIEQSQLQAIPQQFSAFLNSGKALLKSTQESDLPEIQRLVRAGINLRYQNKDNKDALSLAIDNNDLITFVSLLDSLNAPLPRLFATETLCYLMFKQDWPTAAQKLLDKGAKVYVNELISPIHIACAFGRFQTVLRLLTNPADLNRVDSEKRTPLSLAAMWGRGSIVEVLASKAVTALNHTDKDGYTPLALALKAQYPDFSIIKCLIDKGANVNLYPFEGEAPIFLALNQRRFDIARLIVTKGKADVTFFDSEGSSVLIKASQCCDELLFSNILSFLSHQLTPSDLSLMLNARDKHQKNALCYLAESKNIGVELQVEMLLTKGAGIIWSEATFSPLCIAMQSENQPVFMMLLDRISKLDKIQAQHLLNTKDLNGSSPFELATQTINPIQLPMKQYFRNVWNRIN